VIVISGDMAFGVNAMELETAVRHRIPLVVIVANNQGLSGALHHTRHYPQADAEPVTLFQPDIRYEQMAAALGAHGEFVEQPHDIGPAVQRALAAGRPACINVRVDPHAAHL
jgi:thiamine pyrophosphate-dependent acetolactate synthase large subunit-like protein